MTDDTKARVLKFLIDDEGEGAPIGYISMQVKANPNTVRRALGELKKEGSVSTMKGETTILYYHERPTKGTPLRGRR